MEQPLGKYHHRQATLPGYRPLLDRKVVLVHWSDDAKVTGIADGKVVFHKPVEKIEQMIEDFDLVVEG